jgi:hemin uptake protein HemP
MSSTLSIRPMTALQATLKPLSPRDDLLRGNRELVIEHRGQEYRLLRTRNDRLILNK